MAKVEILKQFKLEFLQLGLLLSAMPSKKKKKKRQTNIENRTIIWGGIQQFSKTPRSVPQNKCF